jgi:hypothetical protein
MQIDNIATHATLTIGIFVIYIMMIEVHLKISRKLFQLKDPKRIIFWWRAYGVAFLSIFLFLLFVPLMTHPASELETIQEIVFVVIRSGGHALLFLLYLFVVRIKSLEYFSRKYLELINKNNSHQ